MSTEWLCIVIKTDDLMASHKRQIIIVSKIKLLIIVIIISFYNYGFFQRNIVPSTHWFWPPEVMWSSMASFMADMSGTSIHRGVTRKFTGRRQLPSQTICPETTPTNYRVEAHANGRKLLFTCSSSFFFINKTVIELIFAHSIYLVIASYPEVS